MSSEVRTAYHEAGHAMIALAAGLRLGVVTIVPEAGTDTLGSVTLELDFTPAPQLPPLTAPERAALKAFEAVYAVAGEVAEEIAFGTATGGCDSDQLAGGAAIEAVNDLTAAPPWAVRQVTRAAARDYLSTNWEKVTLLAVALLSERSMTGTRAQELVGKVPALDLKPVSGAVEFWAGRMAARAHR